LLLFRLAADTVSIKGTLRIHYTDQQEDVNKGRDNSVLVRVAIKQTGEIDAHVIDLISRGNTKEAIVETEKEIVQALIVLCVRLRAFSNRFLDPLRQFSSQWWTRTRVASPM